MSEDNIIEGSSSIEGGAASLPGDLPDNLPAGARVEYYGQGVIVRAPNGKFLPGTQSPHMITSDNARSMRERNKELTARLIAEEIGKRAGTFPARAVAVAAGDMWEQIVTQEKSNPKYRYDTWRGLAGAAELLADRREGQNDNGVTLSLSNDLARVLVDKLADLMRSNGQ